MTSRAAVALAERFGVSPWTVWGVARVLDKHCDCEMTFTLEFLQAHGADTEPRSTATIVAINSLAYRGANSDEVSSLVRRVWDAGDTLPVT